MSLRIRRGTNAERQGITFDLGEIVWTTDTQQLWVGDGVTQGAVNPGASLAGTNLTYNPTTRRLDVSNLTTDGVTQGTTNKYFSTELAQAAAASLFELGTHTGITFTYDNAQNKINATVTVTGGGNFNLLDDTTPELGGNLGLNGNNITGSGNIDIIGNIESTGTLYLGGGLGGDLTLNEHDIIGTGNIAINGTFSALGGLVGNLDINNGDIIGDGDIDITGTLTVGTILASVGLAGPLYLNTHSISGTGDIDITGTITSSGTITGDLTGDVTGQVTGSLVGNVYASNGETLIIDAETNTVGTAETLFTGKGMSAGARPAEITSTNTAGPSLTVFGSVGAGLQYSAHRLSGVNPISTLAEDFLGTLGIYGYNGTEYRFAGGIASQWEAGATLSDVYPKSTTLLVASSGGSTSAIASLNSAGTFSAPSIKTGSYNGSMSYPATPTADLFLIALGNLVVGNL